MALWALGLMWQRLALPAGAQWLARKYWRCWVLYAIFASLLLAASGHQRATPIAGAGHQASSLRERPSPRCWVEARWRSWSPSRLVLWGLCA